MLKKIIPILFCIIFTVLVSGCANKSKTGSHNTIVSESRQQTSEQDGAKQIKPVNDSGSPVNSNQKNLTSDSNSESAGSILRTLEPEAKKKLDIFFSNFAEVYLKPFKEGQYDNVELVRFGIRHNIINNPSRIEKRGDGNLQIEAKYVVESVEKYFGVTPEHCDIPNELIVYSRIGYYFMGTYGAPSGTPLISL